MDDALRRARRSQRRSRRTICVVVAMLPLVVTGWAPSAAADPPPAAGPGPTTPVASTTTSPDAASTTTAPGGTTTTTLSKPTVTAGPGGFGAPHTDPNAPPGPKMPDPSPEVRVLLEQLLNQNQQKLVAHKADVAKQHAVDISHYLDAEDAAAKRVRKAEGDVAHATAVLKRIDAQLREDAIARYMSPGPPKLQFLVNSDDAMDRTRTVLSDATIGVHLQQRLDEIAHRKDLEKVVDARRRALATRKAATDRARERARKAEAAIEKQQAKAEAEMRLVTTMQSTSGSRGASASAVDGPGRTWSLPIEGASVFSAKELADWFVRRGHPSHARASITDLAHDYIQEGKDQGIRGDMAFAQSILETGSFSNPDTIALNNFAGIGHCDTCASGFAFATPQLGVRAQIQLLAQYAQRDVKLAHPLVDHRLHGPSGCCQTWGQLTHTWATNGNYGPKIMGVYREMLWWLVKERGMTPQVGPR